MLRIRFCRARCITRGFVCNDLPRPSLVLGNLKTSWHETCTSCHQARRWKLRCTLAPSFTPSAVEGAQCVKLSHATHLLTVTMARRSTAGPTGSGVPRPFQDLSVELENAQRVQQLSRRGSTQNVALGKPATKKTVPDWLLAAERR